MTIDRGPTWSEEHRHACEVRFICSLPTREARRRYFDGLTNAQGRLIKPLAALRGEDVVQRLRADVLAEWARRMTRAAPCPQQEGEGAHGHAVDRPGELASRTTSVPDGGSSLAPGREGPLRRVGCVDSGVGA